MSTDQDTKTDAIATNVIPTPALSNVELREILESFLSSADRPEHTMNFYQLDGYVRALVAGPEITDIVEWMPLIFVDQKPNFKDQNQELIITQVLNSLYNSHRVQLLGNICELPCAYQYSDSRDERNNVEQWARGFMQGFIVCQERWNFFLEEGQTAHELPAIIKTTIYDEIDATLAVISSVADADYAVAIGKTPDEIKQMFNQLPAQIVSYGKASLLIRKYM